MNDVDLTNYIVQGGALAVLAVFMLHVGPRMLDKRVDALKDISDKWAADHEAERTERARDRDEERTERARLHVELQRTITAAAQLIVAALAGRVPPGDHPHG